MRAPFLADAAMIGRMVTRLPNLGIETEIAHELLGRRKACDIADRSEHAESHSHVDAADGHQSFDLLVFQSILRKVSVQNRKHGIQTIMLFQMARDDAFLVLGDRLRSEPSPAPF